MDAWLLRSCTPYEIFHFRKSKTNRKKNVVAFCHRMDLCYHLIHAVLWIHYNRKGNYSTTNFLSLSACARIIRNASLQIIPHLRDSMRLRKIDAAADNNN